MLDHVCPWQVRRANSYTSIHKCFKQNRDMLKKVLAKISSNRGKSRTFIHSNFYPPNFFWFILTQRFYKKGRPLISKLVPNYKRMKLM